MKKHKEQDQLQKQRKQEEQWQRQRNLNEENKLHDINDRKDAVLGPFRRAMAPSAELEAETSTQGTQKNPPPTIIHFPPVDEKQQQDKARPERTRRPSRQRPKTGAGVHAKKRMRHLDEPHKQEKTAGCPSHQPNLRASCWRRIQTTVGSWS